MKSYSLSAKILKRVGTWKDSTRPKNMGSDFLPAFNENHVTPRGGPSWEEKVSGGQAQPRVLFSRTARLNIIWSR